jgi:hypothetical protein
VAKRGVHAGVAPVHQYGHHGGHILVGKHHFELASYVSVIISFATTYVYRAAPVDI